MRLSDGTPYEVIGAVRVSHCDGCEYPQSYGKIVVGVEIEIEGEKAHWCAECLKIAQAEGRVS